MKQETVYKHILQIAIVPVLAYKLIVEGLFLCYVSPLTVILLVLNVLTMQKYNTTWKELVKKWKDNVKNKRYTNKEE
ncbi:hypothetical protein P9X10_00995 [Bacillus cereus]|nr:hypothetical protein [Bacillus cereus]